MQSVVEADSKPRTEPSIDARLAALEDQIRALRPKVERGTLEDKLAIIVFSGEMDKVMASFIIATGAAAMGMEVHLFFTFWGTSVLKADRPQAGGKSLLQRMFGWMVPKGPEALPLSRLNFGGAGPAMMKTLMRRHKTASIAELITVAIETGVHFHICTMSMELMGIQPQELRTIEGLDYCGVAKFLEVADRGKHTLFI
jgi:peroxiredoxin family protein